MTPVVAQPEQGRAPRSWARLPAVLTALCAMLLGQGVAAAADPQDPHQLLDRMVEAARTLSYDGTFVYRSGTVVESMRILHRHDERGERERLVSLDGVAREVIRDNDKVTCILPDTDEVLVGKRRLRGVNAGPLFSAGEIPGQYRVALVGKDRVAGRKAARLAVRPLDDRRYGYELWVDLHSGLLLRSALISPAGEVLEELAYTSLTVPAEIPDDMLESSLSGPGIRRYDVSDQPTATEPGGTSAWQIGGLPKGFELRERVFGVIAQSDVPIEHLVYSDGLASLSVFIEKLANRAEAMEGPSRMGAVSAFGRMVGDHQVTVVGEVPMVTVETVGRAVQPR